MRNTLGVYPIEIFFPTIKDIYIYIYIYISHCLINYLIMALLQRKIFLQMAFTTAGLSKISSPISFGLVGD